MHLFYEAVYNYNKHNISIAIEELKKYLTFDKRFPPAYGLLTYIFSEHFANYEESIAILTEAIQFLHKIAQTEDLICHFRKGFRS